MAAKRDGTTVDPSTISLMACKDERALRIAACTTNSVLVGTKTPAGFRSTIVELDTAIDWLDKLVASELRKSKRRKA